MPGLIGKKLGMTSIFDANKRYVACTLIEVQPNAVVQLKTAEKDGYEAVQLGYGDKKDKHTNKPEQGHFKKAGVTPKRMLREFDFDPSEYKVGQAISVDYFAEGEFVDVVGTSKGKGFQGVVKRWGFAGVGGQTHGQHNRLRHPGSIGACSFPSRVFPGLRMAGRTGGDRVLIKNLRVLKVVKDKNLIVISGSVPGAINSHVMIYN